jgi:hypothetical protein
MKQSEEEKEERKTITVIEMFLTMLLIACSQGKAGLLGGAIIGVLVPVVIELGLLFSKWLVKKYSYTSVFITIIAIISPVTGLFFTPLGLFLGVTAMKSYDLTPKEDRKVIILILGIVGALVSIVNAILGMNLYS